MCVQIPGVCVLLSTVIVLGRGLGCAYYMELLAQVEIA